MKIRAHRLMLVGPRLTQGRRHFNSAMHELSENETETSVGTSKIERIDKGIS